MLIASMIIVVLGMVSFIAMAIQYGKTLQETKHVKNKAEEYEIIEHERIKSDSIRGNAKRVQSDYID